MRGPLAIFLACVALHAQSADIRVDVNLVTVTCAVTDRAGAPAKSLRIEDFTLRDNGKPQRIDHLWQEADLPLTIALVVDVSGSQSAFVEQHRHSVAQFLSQVVGPKDRALLATIAEHVTLVTDFTGSVEDLRRGVDHIDPTQSHGETIGEPCPMFGCGGTALWNGIYAVASQRMRWTQGRKALIVLSDGFDTGSIHTLSDAIESLQEAGTVVYAIKYVDNAAITRRSERIRGLERLTDQTGGYTFPNPEDRLSAVFSKIEDDLRNLYVLAFTPPESARDGRFHRLEVRTVRKDLVTRARAGYYAQSR